MSKIIFMGRSNIFFPRPKLLYDIDSYNFFPFVIEATGIIGRSGSVIIVVGNSKNDELGKPYRGVCDAISERIRMSCAGMIGIITCYHGDEKCECKFPGTRLFEDAASDFNVELSECYMIAGAANEFNAAKAAGIKNIVIVKKPSRDWSKKAKEFAAKECENLLEAAIFLKDVIN